MHSIISIIVPVYNSENTLTRCLDSILSQSFVDYECIIVDDGSTDGSSRICEEYAKRDSRFSVFHKKNEGVSSARNLALENATGSWITFIDSDDYVQDNYLSYMISEISSSVDLVIGSSLAINNLRSHTMCGCVPKGLYEIKSSVVENSLSLTEFKVPWGKLFKRSLMNGLRFDIYMKVGEDAHFMLQYLHVAKLIKVLENNDSLPCNYVYVSPPLSFEKKYKMSVAEAVYHTIQTDSAYLKLNISSKSFEILIPQVGYELCVDDIAQNGHLWYKNKEIERICLRRSKNLGIIPYIKTWISFYVVNKIRYRHCVKQCVPIEEA